MISVGKAARLLGTSIKKEIPLAVVCDVVAYYEANKTEDNAWVMLPIANFDCYYGNTNFSKKWLSKIPDTILTREVSNGVSRVKVNI